MFKKIEDFEKELVNSSSLMSNSEMKKVKKDLESSFPNFKSIFKQISKKENVKLIKCKMKLKVVVINKVPFCFSLQKSRYIPTLKTLHKYPGMLPRIQVDRGAVKHILNGANVMCRGITSEGGDIPVDLPKGEWVAIHVEGKVLPIGIGRLELSTNDIKKKNEGIGIEVITMLSDSFYRLDKFER